MRRVLMALSHASFEDWLCMGIFIAALLALLEF